jgi:hypothetical protein
VPQNGFVLEEEKQNGHIHENGNEPVPVFNDGNTIKIEMDLPNEEEEDVVMEGSPVTEVQNDHISDFA